MSDAYADLGLRGPLEDLEVIKTVYSKKARKHHPDQGGDAREFDKVTQAWELLQNPARKAALDAELLAAQHPAPGPSFDPHHEASTAGEGERTCPQRRTATATRPVADENPWLTHAQSVTATRSRLPWFAPTAGLCAFAAVWLLAVTTVQSPAALTIEMFGEPPVTMLRAWALTAIAWGLVLLAVPAVLPVALIIAGLSGVATVALYGTGYPVAHGLAVGFVLAALLSVRNARTTWSAMRALHLRRTSIGAVMGTPATVGETQLASLASEIATNTAGAWSASHFTVGFTVAQLVFVGARAGVLISADHVPLPSRVLGGTDWQRVAEALHTGDIARIRKALSAHGFAPCLYVVTGPRTGGSETVALDKHTTVTMLSPGMAPAVIGSALVLEQDTVTRRSVRIARALNALTST